MEEENNCSLFEQIVKISGVDIQNEEELRPHKDNEEILADLYAHSKPTLAEYFYSVALPTLKKEDGYFNWIVLMTMFRETLNMLSIEIYKFRNHGEAALEEVEKTKWAAQAAHQRKHQENVFMCACLIFRIPFPQDLTLFQNEYKDSLDVLDNLPSTKRIDISEKKRISEVLKTLNKNNTDDQDTILHDFHLDEFIENKLNNIDLNRDRIKIEMTKYVSNFLHTLPGANPEYVSTNCLFHYLMLILRQFELTLASISQRYNELTGEDMEEKELALKSFKVVKKQQLVILLCIGLIYHIQIPEDLSWFTFEICKDE